MLFLLHSQDGDVDIRFPKREVLDGGVNVPMYKGLLRPEDVATQPLINTVGDKNISKPETVDEAVGRLVSEMNLKALNQVARMSEDDLIDLHFTAGMWIRNNSSTRGTTSCYSPAGRFRETCPFTGHRCTWSSSDHCGRGCRKPTS
jgi:hypothetical protein